LVGEGNAARPFFTIGVTTYNRRELLRQTLDSILAQTFTDFEVIVGNDYPDETLNGELLGISDPRIRFVNHPRNLQEVGNMNALLALASGRYFTWLADDDLYECDFLRTGHDLLSETGFPPGLFSSYRIIRGTRVSRTSLISKSPVRVLTGREFLGNYFAGRLKLISIYGLFDIAALRNVVGGMEELCSSAIGVYGEYFFLVRCSLLERIVYVNTPFVLFRAHVGSWGGNNIELDKYREAGPELVRRCGKVLRHPSLSGDLNRNLLGVCSIHLYQYAGKLGLAGAPGRSFGFIAIFDMLARFFAETTRIHRSFIEAGGVDGIRANLRFAWIRFFYSVLMIARGVVVKWTGRSRRHD
jgi:glycosyltransferase involved in cell wall biosynthesis